MSHTHAKVTFLVIFFALATGGASAASTPSLESQVDAPQNIKQAREAIRKRLDAAATVVNKSNHSPRIAQWYNNRFSDRSFSNW